MLSRKLAPKHQKLIRQCYPPGRAPEKRPNASELSYLLYYVSTRKVKLQKVAAYLEKSAKSDLYKEKVGNVQVTLAIVDALIDRCHSELNLFADSVVEIVSLVVSSSKDIGLCQHACKVFTTFCKYHDGALFSGSDENYVHAYHGLVAHFAGIPEQNRSIATTSNAMRQWEQIAVNACEAVSASPAMGTPAGQVDIGVIVRLALKNLCVDDDGSKLLELQWQRDNSTRLHRLSSRRTGADWNFFVEKFEGMENSNKRRSQDVVNRLSHEDTRRSESQEKDKENDSDGSSSSPDSDPIMESSLRTLTNLLDTTVTAQVRKTSHKVLQFIIDNKCPQLWSTTLVGLMAQWTPVQLRFVIVDALVDMVVELQLTELDQQLIAVRLICSLLSSAVNLVGISVMDILRVLTSHQHSILSSNLGREDLVMRKRANELLLSMRDAISALATHIYYGDQVTDMISEGLSFIHDTGSVTRRQSFDETVHTNGNNGHLEESTLTQVKKLDSKIVLNDLANVKYIIQVASSALSKGAINPVPLQVWLDSDLMIAHPDLRVPHEYTETFSAFLSTELYSFDRVLANNTSKFATSENSRTIDTMMQVIATLILSESTFKAHNYSAAYQWFESCLQYIGPVAALKALPHMISLYIQGQAIEQSSGTQYQNQHNGVSSKQGAVMCSFALTVLVRVAKRFNQAELAQTLLNMIKDRKSTRSFIDVDSPSLSPAELERLNPAPAPAPLDRAQLLSQFAVGELSSDAKGTLFGIDLDETTESEKSGGFGTDGGVNSMMGPVSPTIPELLMTRSRSVRGSSISLSVMTDSPTSPSNNQAHFVNGRREFSPKVSDLKRAMAQSNQHHLQQQQKMQQPDVARANNSANEKVNIDQLLNGLNLGGMDGLLTGTN